MATAILLPAPELQFCDADGKPYAGGSLATYVPGTTTPKATWVDPGEAALQTNPVILDAAGRCILYGSGDYRLILRDAAGNLIYDQLSSTVVSDAMYPVVSAPTIADAQVLLGITGFATSSDLASAISTEQTARIAADNAEIAARTAADANLQSQITALAARVTTLEGHGGSLPLVQGGSAVSDTDGHKTVTYPTSYSSQPAVVVSAAGAGYGAECIVVNSNTNTHFDVWFAFPVNHAASSRANQFRLGRDGAGVVASLFRAAFPSATLIDADGNLSAAWRGFFQSLYARTGGSNGISSDTSQLEAELDAERAARIAGDAALANGLAAERTARQNADTAEAQARHNEILSEAAARKAADALLVPIAQLCTMWAGCNLAFLPTTDPGGGKPWNDGGHIAVGTPSVAVVDIGLEDGTGRWGLEDGTGAWLWG